MCVMYLVELNTEKNSDTNSWLLTMLTDRHMYVDNAKYVKVVLIRATLSLKIINDLITCILKIKDLAFCKARIDWCK